MSSHDAPAKDSFVTCPRCFYLLTRDNKLCPECGLDAVRIIEFYDALAFHWNRRRVMLLPVSIAGFFLVAALAFIISVVLLGTHDQFDRAVRLGTYALIATIGLISWRTVLCLAHALCPGGPRHPLVVFSVVAGAAHVILPILVCAAIFHGTYAATYALMGLIIRPATVVVVSLTVVAMYASSLIAIAYFRLRFVCGLRVVAKWRAALMVACLFICATLIAVGVLSVTWHLMQGWSPGPGQRSFIYEGLLYWTGVLGTCALLWRSSGGRRMNLPRNEINLSIPDH